MSEIHPTHQACLEAIDRIARTPDGAAMYVLLQRRLMQVSFSPTDGALRSDEGERTFASKLIVMMAKGIFESGGRSGITGSSSGPDGREQPVLVPVSKPIGPERRGIGRRIGEHTIVPGWNDRET